MKRLLVTLAALVSVPAWAADCYITEYSSVIVDQNGRVVIPVAQGEVATQRVTYTTSAQSAAFNTSTKFIRIVCDAAAHYLFSPNPTADADDPYIPANAPEYFGVTPGEEVAFYDGSS